MLSVGDILGGTQESLREDTAWLSAETDPGLVHTAKMTALGMEWPKALDLPLAHTGSS